MPEDNEVKPKQTDVIDKIWGIFISLRLVVILLLVLSVLSIVGTVIDRKSVV